MTTTNSRPDLLAQLEEGIVTLTSSDAWEDHLVFQSRFHRYSYSNTLLIASQNHRATHVAGFTAWRRLNRAVRRGEKAIWVLAPMLGRRTNPAEDVDEPVIRGFKYVPVFDISQTEGENPPTVCARLSGDDPGDLFDQLVAVARSIGFTVEDHEFGDTTSGDCSPSDHRIRVERRNPPAQRVKTLAHELAHALLHDRAGRSGSRRIGGRVHRIRCLPDLRDGHGRLQLRIRGHMGGRRSPGDHRHQEILRPDPEGCSVHPPGRRGRADT